MSSSAARMLGGVVDLSIYGIDGVTEICHNPSFDELYAEETREDLEGFERATLTDLGALAVDTGEFTGRSPKQANRWCGLERPECCRHQTTIRQTLICSRYLLWREQRHPHCGALCYGSSVASTLR